MDELVIGTLKVVLLVVALEIAVVLTVGMVCMLKEVFNK